MVPKRLGRGIYLPLVLQALTLLTVGACGPTPEPKPPEVQATDGGFPIVPGDGGDNEDPLEGAAAIPECAKACSNLKKLGCPEAEKPVGGKTCYAVCRDAEQSGKISLKPVCVAKATSVTEVRTCRTVRCQQKQK